MAELLNRGRDARPSTASLMCWPVLLPWRVTECRTSSRDDELPSTQLSGDRGRFVRKAFGEDQILRSNRIVRLTNETLRRVVLGTRVGVQCAVVDATELGRRARERRANAALNFGFRRRRRRLQGGRRSGRIIGRSGGRLGGRLRYGRLRPGRLRL